MKKYITLFLIPILSFLNLQAQDYSFVVCNDDYNSKIAPNDNFVSEYIIKIDLKEATILPENRKLYLYAYILGEKIIIDSATIRSKTAVFQKKQNFTENNKEKLQTGFFKIDFYENMPPLVLNHKNNIKITAKNDKFYIEKSDENKILWTLSGFPQNDLLYDIKGSFLSQFLNFTNELYSFVYEDKTSISEFENILKKFDFSDARYCNSTSFKDFMEMLGLYLSSENFSVEQIKSIVNEILECSGRGGKRLKNNYRYACYNLFLSKGDPFYESVMLDIYDNSDKSWIPDDMLRSVKRQMDKARRLAVGTQIPELRAYDIDGKIHSTKDITTKYTILWFWDPDCDHCQEETPILHELYETKADVLDFEVFAVEVNDDFERWKAFSEQNNLSDWINLSTSMGEPNIDFIEYFDIVTTPVVLLIDNSQKHAIIARQKSLEEIIDLIEKQE